MEEEIDRSKLNVILPENKYFNMLPDEIKEGIVNITRLEVLNYIKEKYNFRSTAYAKALLSYNFYKFMSKSNFKTESDFNKSAITEPWLVFDICSGYTVAWLRYVLTFVTGEMIRKDIFWIDCLIQLTELLIKPNKYNDKCNSDNIFAKNSEIDIRNLLIKYGIGYDSEALNKLKKYKASQLKQKNKFGVKIPPGTLFDTLPKELQDKIIKMAIRQSYQDKVVGGVGKMRKTAFYIEVLIYYWTQYQPKDIDNAYKVPWEILNINKPYTQAWLETASRFIPYSVVQTDDFWTYCLYHLTKQIKESQFQSRIPTTSVIRNVSIKYVKILLMKYGRDINEVNDDELDNFTQASEDLEADIKKIEKKKLKQNNKFGVNIPPGTRFDMLPPELIQIINTKANLLNLQRSMYTIEYLKMMLQYFWYLYEPDIASKYVNKSPWEILDVAESYTIDWLKRANETIYKLTKEKIQNNVFLGDCIIKLLSSYNFSLKNWSNFNKKQTDNILLSDSYIRVFLIKYGYDSKKLQQDFIGIAEKGILNYDKIKKFLVDKVNKLEKEQKK